MKYSVHVRCACTGTDGKPLGQECPQLWRKGRDGQPATGKDGKRVWAGNRHGTAGFATRVPTSGGPKLVKRFGYGTKEAARDGAEHVGKLLDLASDGTSRMKIGDMIAATRRGSALPAVEDVRRRIGLGLDPGSTGVTVGEAWEAWLSGKKRLRRSSRERLEVAGRHWILPVLADVPLERLNNAHVSEVFARMERISAEIIARRGDARRGEAVGLRWADADLDAGYVRVRRPIVLIGAEVVESTPKTKTGDRPIWLDAESARLLREHRKAQLKTRLKAGEAWQDDDLIFCKDDGAPYRPDYVARRFKALAAQAGLPVIKLHEGRHSAASLARDAEVDPEIRRKTLGHADAAMTSHYTHIEAQAHRAAAEAVAKLVSEA